MNIQRIVSFLFVASLGAILLDSCKSDPNSPGIEYMPDMYRSPSFETYGENIVYGDTVLEARMPASNTIPRGEDYLPYGLPNSYEGYMAADSLKNPLNSSEELVAEGKAIYTRFCVHCHGKKGQGDGTVPTNSDYPNPPAYNKGLKDLSEGKMFHTITYGKNLMGSHASQLTKTERWKVILYVQTLQGQGQEVKKESEETAAETESVESEENAG